MFDPIILSDWAELASFHEKSGLEELKQLNESGLISGDRVFGLLERDFFLEDIEQEVARALKPDSSNENHLDSHQIILQLATTESGRTHLVTTNFDSLFEDCKPSVKHYQPPKLPNLSAGDILDGITYLHGRVNKDYTGSDPEGSGFVLTSSQYGRAYLSDGWATSFFKDVLERYTVVFIGYSADDPPVQYLLEALNSKSVQHKIYAFEQGDEQGASAKWVHKGVTAIPFEGFDLLWDTLASWAKRAHNPEEWCKGPTAMEPYERGLIAHIVSSEQGAKLFFRAENTPPAEWLFVFDSKLRIEGPAHQRLMGLDENNDPSPFDLYGLDSDPAPSEITEYQQNALWNAFDRTPAGYHFSAESSEPHNRLKFLGSWLCKVMTQIEALQWASHQQGLPAEIHDILDLQLKNIKSDDRIVAQAWRYLFESWQSPSTNELQLMPYDLKEDIKNYGWSNVTFRRFTKSIQPYIHAGPRSSFWYSDLKDVTSPSHLLDLDVAYPSAPQVEVPNEYLTQVARAIKHQLTLASQLEAEIGNERLHNFDTHIVSSTPDSSWRSQNEISAYVILYLNTILKLKEHDINAAKREILTWGFENPISVRLNIWAASKKELTSPRCANEIFCELVPVQKRNPLQSLNL